MTAQIAILNKSAIALATDSAVTIDSRTGRKTYNTVNKLFTLSKYAPVGAMFYGNAELMGVPWETILKMYRRRLGSKTFSTLDQYVENFIAFLESTERVFPAELQRRYTEECFAGALEEIRAETDKKVKAVLQKQEKVTGAFVEKTLSNIIKQYLRMLLRKERLQQFTRDWRRKFIAEFKEDCERLSAEFLQELPRSPRDVARLHAIALNLVTRDHFSGAMSGVVIAGFGESEHFPQLRSLHVEGIAHGILKYKADRRAEISANNTAQITPFAQADMVSEFMEGVHPSFVEFFQTRLMEMFKLLPEEILKCTGVAGKPEHADCQRQLRDLFAKLLRDLNDDQGSFRRCEHIDPVINTVAVLPKDELATMAAALVNLTQFRQKITLQAETVGGPIDVAVISKGDGFVWINRKHYFDTKLNPFFVANYYKDCSGEK